MLTGCVQSVFFPRVNTATARVLAAEGCDVIIPREQGCCGALSLHSGRLAEAGRFAARTIEAFEGAGVDAIVVNSAGCGSAMKEYERLFGHSPSRPMRPGGGAVGAGPRPHRVPRRAPVRRAPAPGAGAAGLPRRLPPRARAADHRASRGRCCATSPGLELVELGTRDLLRFGWRVQPAEPDAARRTRRAEGGRGASTRARRW